MAKDETQEKQTIVQILEEAIEKEHDSNEFYANAAKQSAKPSAKRMFLRLAEMEKDHVVELSKMLADIKAQAIVDSAMTGGH